MIKKKVMLTVLALMAVAFFGSCKTVPKDPYAQANEAFLAQAKGETFRVVMMSDRFEVRQKKFENSISRADDPSGDEYFMERLKKMDVIEAAREGVIKVWVYPDSGRLMKVRFISSTYIEEVDRLIIDDIQRWTFKYQRGVYPQNFTIRYRVVLQKKSSRSQAR